MMIFYCHISFLGWFLVEKRNNLLFPMVTPFQDELLRIHRQLTGWKQRLPHEAEDDPSLGTTPPGRWWCGWGVFTQKKQTLPRGNQGCEMAEFYPCFFVAEGKSSFDTKVVCDLKPDQVRAWNMTMYRMVVFFPRCNFHPRCHRRVEDLYKSQRTKMAISYIQDPSAKASLMLFNYRNPFS